ncbi:CPBP family intramembrane glutamic endopeptidase [Nocardiopsis sp. MG754419]|uniref:CPBP family intramembrane glutamic endopeptidase n=1 Tax=Nocardiopsis sp. MG754419 TaxID=2259865 RepID=UPI001BAB74EB|nr:type II CAAX endopeptidase family protein [Nocardiopsis sp. MG754419]MBR8744085.1 CPBP family intramembrane metalloprotease [Nocardiopsis sp. MG754419]
MSTRPGHSRRSIPDDSIAPPRPGWPEIGVGLLAAVLTTALLVFFGPVGPLDLDPVVFGLLVAAWSGVVGLVGFAAAAMLRIRSLAAFGVRRTTWRWMLIGVAAGLFAFLFKGVVNAGLIAVGFDSDPQGMYYDAAGGGVWPLVLTLLFLSILTPIGEEFLFRGVITNALLRYGPVIGVVSGSLIFALFHGINLAFPTAFVVGVVAAEVMRRSGSIWPAVVVHVVNNLGLPLFVLFSGIVDVG